MPDFDAVMIGTGQAGPSLASRLCGQGKKVAIIERKLFGGTCVNTGCIPTKTMVASARAAFMARRSPDFGVNIDGDIRVDMKKVKERKVIEKLREKSYRDYLKESIRKEQADSDEKAAIRFGRQVQQR